MVDVAVWGDADIGDYPDYETNAFSTVTNGIKVEYCLGSDPSFYVMFTGNGLNGAPSTISLRHYIDLSGAEVN
jgi:hypothetical protein